jgi:hypothetical protein
LFVLMSSTNCSSSNIASSSYSLIVEPSFQSRASSASLAVLLSFYQADQPLGPPDHVLLLLAQHRIEFPVIMLCVMLFIGIGNVLVALVYVFGQLLEMFIGCGDLLSV